jgi:DNA-binding protein HU-beta
MNKAELVNRVAAEVGYSKKLVDAVLNTALTRIMLEVADGQKVKILGFGSFERRTLSAREGRNPQTGETLQIPAKTVPRFAPGKHFRELTDA